VFEITSLDVPHGFNVPDLGVRTDVKPGAPARISLTPDRAGTGADATLTLTGAGFDSTSTVSLVSSGGTTSGKANPWVKTTGW